MADLSSLVHQATEICRSLFNSRELLNTLGKPEFTLASFIVLNVVVFTETGLLVGFFLPGDSLLVTAGIVCYNSGWNLPLLMVTLWTAAIVGDSVGYSIGRKTGPRIFTREKSIFFAKDHLIKAQHFYERHGGKTIILARFIPFLRTFAPVVAGVGRMNYGQFLFYNIFGGIGWITSMLLIGYFLTRLIDPVFQHLLHKEQFTVRDHIEKVIIVVVLLSISPGLVPWFRSKLRRGQAKRDEAEDITSHELPAEAIPGELIDLKTPLIEDEDLAAQAELILADPDESTSLVEEPVQSEITNGQPHHVSGDSSRTTSRELDEVADQVASAKERIPGAPPIDFTGPSLVVLRGRKISAAYPLYEGENYVGRADEPPVDIDLEEQEDPDNIFSSRQHCVITLTNGEFYIQDLNSKNGTFVNRLRIPRGQKRPLQRDDVIQIGTVRLKLKTEQS
jgi:membrane-associated protein